MKNIFLIVYCLFCTAVFGREMTLKSTDSNTFDLEMLDMLDEYLAKDYLEKLGYDYQNTSGVMVENTEIDTPFIDWSQVQERMRLLNQKSPINLAYNNEVAGMIQAYLKRKALMSRLMGLTPQYFTLFESQLDKHDMPLELKYLAIVESALNPLAKSRVGATGLWQFMYSTAKMQGLEINSFIDERRDPVLATEAACKYLKSLYNRYGNWELALAAYNSGPGNVNKAIRRAGGSTNFWEIKKYLPKETRGYVPAFIAVNYVITHAKEHGITPSYPVFLHQQLETVEVQYPITFKELAQQLDLSPEYLKYINPVFKTEFIPVMNEISQKIMLPAEKIGLFIQKENDIYGDIAQKQTREMLFYAGNYEKEEEIIYHKVVAGETIYSIAKKYKTSVKKIQDWNNKRYKSLRAGERLKVYVSSDVYNKMKNAQKIVGNQKKR